MAVSGGNNGGRDRLGRFARGNRASVGHGGSTEIARLGAAALAVVRPERLAGLFDALLRRAEHGNAKAAKVVPAYPLGKPLNLDRLDQRERVEPDNTSPRSSPPRWAGRFCSRSRRSYRHAPLTLGSLRCLHGPHNPHAASTLVFMKQPG